MKITEEFIKKMTLQRNLQSCVTNSVILARTIQELQRAVEEIQLKVGLPRSSNETE